MHIDIEQALLTRLLNKPNEIWDCLELKSDSFLTEQHKKIYEAILYLRKKGMPVTLDTVKELLDDVDKEYLIDLMGDVATTPAKDLSQYLTAESEKYTMMNNLMTLLNTADADKKTDFFTELNEITLRSIDTTSGGSIDEMKQDLERKMKGEEIGISTSIIDLDTYINKLQKGRLYIVGARPAMGKTAFMCSLIEQIEKQHKVGVLSLEMTSAEIKQRIACLRGNIKHYLIEKGLCDIKTAELYFKCLDEIDTNLKINDTAGLNRFQIGAIVRNMVIKEKCSIIFVDHLGLIKTDARTNLAHEIGENTTALKCLAKQYKIPIVCLCQINRGVEQGGNKKPRLSDLRDSGRIEEDADCVILLYRENYYNDGTDNEAEYCVAKCRNGRTGVVTGYFEGEYMRWS